MTTPSAPVNPDTPKLELTGSSQFNAWLFEQKLSLGFTTYQAGKLFLIGLKRDGGLSAFERTFNASMGLYATPQTLYMSSLYQLWRFENTLEPGQTHGSYDRLYIPRMAWTTGSLNVHDIALDADGRVVFVNTVFGCLATVSEKYSFVPLWKPPFISKLAAEDRCHLNGLAMENGWPRYVTSVSQTDVSGGWRERRRDGGTVTDVRSNTIVCTGLSMPHSPRLYRGKLWLLDSGNGYFGYVDTKTQRFERVTFCPGYARGLAFHGDFAIVGLSNARESKAFSGLALDDNLKEKGAEARCGLQVIDLKSGEVAHTLRIDGVVRELYDVVALPGVRRPMALGLKTDEIRRVVSIAPSVSIVSLK